MRATQRTSTIRAGLTAAGLMPVGEHTVPGPGGNELPANSEARRVSDPAEADFLNAGAWLVVSIKSGDEEGGVTSHRGVVHPDEYVDGGVLQAMVEEELGFTYGQIRSVYRQGPLSADKRELRGLIDARLLALSLAGGHLLELAKAFGWAIEPADKLGGERCKTMERAIERARKEQS